MEKVGWGGITRGGGKDLDYYPGKVGLRLLNLLVNRICTDRIGTCSNHQLIKEPQQSFGSLQSAHVKFKLGGRIPVNVMRT